MVYFLVASVLFNMVLIAALGILAYHTSAQDALCEFNREQWSKWEQRWYKANELVIDKFEHRLRIDGLGSEMELREHKGK